MKRIVAVLFPFLLCAADPAGYVQWSAKDLKGYEQKLKPKMDAQKFAGQQLGTWGNHNAMIGHREGDGLAELHETVADFFVVQSGEATLVVGGTVVEPKTTAPREVRGPKISGGERHKLAAGDAVHIPANTPHQLLVENGKQFTYFIVKVEK
jgi:mannose-6-phosphate isomerase-like protein (cupin superfamily)